MSIVFVHGVPDTPAMWAPLIEALGLSDGEYIAPGLPGFETPAPVGFPCTKDAYADWLIGQIEAEVKATGQPVNIIGHDWGALLTLRVCSLRPDLINSFMVANALIDPQYSGHRMAKLWATPLVGEAVMFLSQYQDFSEALVEAGMPPEIAVKDVAYWKKPMRQAILKLYRSALGLRFRGEWVDDLKNLPERGLIVWGENDPFVDLSVAQRFSDKWSYPLHVLRDTSHWGLIQKPDEVAGLLKDLWR